MVRVNLTRLFCALTVVVAAGCRNDDGAPAIAALTRRVEAAEKAASAARAESAVATQMATRLSYSLASLRNEPAWVETDTNAYGVAATKLGPMPVSVVSMTPYLDGFKVRYQVGNLSAARLVDLKGTVSWSGGTKEFSRLGPIQPGAWVSGEVVVAPAKAEEVKYLWFTLRPDVLSMHQS